ncbi:MAG: hypothetical protein AABW65_03715 [Nanoarchaeota archaeon]
MKIKKKANILDIKTILFVWKKVFGNYKYTLFAVIIALFFYILNAIIGNFFNILDFFKKSDFLSSISFLFSLIFGFHKTSLPSSILTLVIISLLGGILVSLIIYKFNFVRESSQSKGVLSSIAIFLAFLVPGCAACGIGIAALLGLGSFFIYLPFKGIEISVIAIALLLFSIIKTSQDSFTCKHFNTLKPRKFRKWTKKEL